MGIKSLRHIDNNTNVIDKYTSNNNTSTNSISSIDESVENLDMDIFLEENDITNPTSEDIAKIVGNLSEEEYNSFTTGIEDYYQKQIDYLDNVLNGEEGLNKELDSVNKIVRNIQMTASANTESTGSDDPTVVAETLYKQSLKELGVNNYNELIAKQEELKKVCKELNTGLKNTKNLKESAKYDYLNYLKDYADYKINEPTEEEILDLKNYIDKSYTGNKWRQDTGKVETKYLYSEYVKKHPDVNPAEFVQIIEKSATGSDYIIDDIANLDELKILYKISDKQPDMLKKYSYLYDQNPEKAEQYIKDCKYEINNFEGQIKAKEFLDLLAQKDGINDDDALELIANEFGVHGEGLADGIDTFFRGLYYSGEAGYSGVQKLGKKLGLYDGEVYENRTMDASEYKKMYILQALLSNKQKEKMGLINEDGSLVNQNSIIDFSKEYSGAFLSNNYEISQGIGNMLPSIALTACNPVFGSTIGSTAMGLSSGGNAYHSSMVEGHDYVSSLVYGALTGSSEAISERILGGLPGLSDVDEVIDVPSMLNAMRREANQEMFQGVMDIVFNHAIKGEPLPSTEKELKDTALDILKQGAYGAITAGYMQVPSLVSSTVSLKRINNMLKENNIPSYEQNLALDQLKAENVDLRELSDNEIKLKHLDQYLERININKLVSLGIKDEVATIMIREKVNEKVANYMLEKNVSKEEALIELSKKPKKPREDYISKLDLDKYKSSNPDRVYELADIMSKNYKNACNMFFDMAPNVEAKNKLESILLKGEVDGLCFTADVDHRNNPTNEIERRMAMANLYLNNPEAFQGIVKNKVNLYHGTNGVALQSILDNGLCSLAESQNNNIKISTGEEWSRLDVSRSYVSFADVFDLAQGYSGIQNDIGSSDMNFEIIIGTTDEAAKKTGTVTVSSDLCEVGVNKKLDTKDIKVLLVPSEKVEMVKQMVGNRNIEVLPFDETKPYYSVNMGMVEIYEKNASSIKEQLKNNYENKFNQEIKKFAQDNNLTYEVADLMNKNSKMTLEQAKTINEIYLNDPTMNLDDILPETAEDILKLQKLAMAEGMTLKEYGNQKSTDKTSPEIQATADALAAQKRVLAEIAEPDISKDMRALEGNGKYLLGFDKRLKGVESMSRKIISDYNDIKQNNPEFTLENACDRLGDSIRYTLICDPKTYTKDVRSSLQQLIDKGYKVRKFKNTFDNPMYKGINVSLISPNNNIIEVQFHTEQSFKHKDNIGHLYYEIARNDFVSPEAKEIANKLRRDIASKVELPDGVLELKEEEFKNTELKRNINANEQNNNNKSINASFEENYEVYDPDLYRKFVERTEYIQNITSDELPESFSSVEEYKRGYIHYLIEIEGIEKAHNNYIKILCQDPILFDELLNCTDNVENLFINNYILRGEKLNEDVLSNIPLETTLKLLNKPDMKNYINSLNPEDLATFMNNLTKVYKDQAISNSTFIDKICTFNKDDFLSFSESFSSKIPYNIKLFPNDITNDITKYNYMKFSSYLLSNIITEENLCDIDTIQDYYFRMVPRYSDDPDTNNIYNKLFDSTRNLKKELSQRIRDISDIELKDNYNATKLILDTQWRKYYNLVYEINGEERKNTIKLNYDEFGLTDYILNNKELKTALKNGTLKIKNFEINEKASNMFLTEEDGLENGINYIRYLVDGVEKKDIIFCSYVDLYENYKDAKEFKILDIDSLEFQKIPLNKNDVDNFYKITYKLNGEEKSTYLTPKKDFIGDVTLDIDSYINENNLFGAKDFKVEQIERPNVDMSSIKDLSSFNNIFSEKVYGGNQSNVEDLVKEFIYNPTDSPTTIEQKKAKQLIDMIKNTFPNATDADIINVASEYAEHGCYYMAMANAFEAYIGNLENGETIFKEKIGFDLKTMANDESSYNLESLALDMYLRRAQNITGGDISKIKKVEGISGYDTESVFVDYFAEKGIKLEFDWKYININPGNKLNSLITQIANSPDMMHIILASNFDLDFIEKIEPNEIKDKALANASIKEREYNDVDGHAMLVTDVDEDNNIYVSTWSKKAKIAKRNFEQGRKPWITINSIKFELK